MEYFYQTTYFYVIIFLYDRPRGPPGWQIYGSAKVGGASSGSLARPMGHGMSRVNVANFGSCSTQKWLCGEDQSKSKKHPFFSLELLSNPFQPSPEIDIPSVLGVGVQAISWNRFPPLLELRHVFRILQNRAVTLEFMTTWQGLPQSNNLARVLSNISNVVFISFFGYVHSGVWGSEVLQCTSARNFMTSMTSSLGASKSHRIPKDIGDIDMKTYSKGLILVCFHWFHCFPTCDL